MSVKGPSLANSQLHNFDDSREASDVPRKRPSPSSNTNQSKIVPSQAKENTKVENVIASDFIANFKGPPTPLEICLPVIAGEEKYPDQDDLVACDSSVVAKRTYHIVQRWGRVVSIPPQQFLSTILLKRGYNDQILSALSPEIRRPPTAKQLKDYDNEIVWAVRNSDLKKLEELHSTGKSLTACNRFSESIVHMACRRSEKEIVQFLIQNGSDLSIIDDFGRTPLHDACWRPEPRFDIVTMILDVNCGLLQLADLRGSTPLNYVREEHWVLWCAYLFNQLEKYWPMNNGSPSDSEHVAKRQRIEG